MPYRAILNLLICLLALATAVGLLGAAAVVGETPAAVQTTDDTEAVVLAFYDAVNDALRFGDTAALDSVLAAAFVDREPATAGTGDGAGLRRSLAAIRATFPAAQLTVDDLVAVGDQALARVSLGGIDGGAFLGLTVCGTTAARGQLNAVRVADERVVELWGGPGGTPLLEPLRQLLLDPRLDPRQIVELSRLSFPPGAPPVAWAGLDSRLIYVEAGVLSVAIDPRSPKPARLVRAGDDANGWRPVAPGTELSLEAGDLLALPKLTWSVLDNDGAEHVEMVTVALVSPVVGGAAPNRSNHAYQSMPPVYPLSGSPPATRDATAEAGVVAIRPEITARVLAGGVMAELPVEPGRLGLGRATLAPGTELGLGAAAGPVLLAVEAGVLDLAAGPEAAWVRHGADGSNRELAEGTLATGDGALLQAGTALTLRPRGDEPVVALVVTIVSDDATATAASRPSVAGCRL